MTDDLTVKAMSATFPEATKRLLEAIKETETMAASGDIVLHESEGYVMSRLVEPLIEALGFDRHRRQMEFKPFEHLILSTERFEIAMLILKTLNAPEGQDQWANDARNHSQFRGHIIVTNGVEWSIYHPDAKTPDLHFDLAEPGAFWDLLIMGQANGQKSNPLEQ